MDKEFVENIKVVLVLAAGLNIKEYVISKTDINFSPAECGVQLSINIEQTKIPFARTKNIWRLHCAVDWTEKGLDQYIIIQGRCGKQK